MVRVTFLGVGAALPAPGQTNCAYLIDLPGACLLFDCGPAILQQFAAVGRSPGEVTHVFVSHAHGDHALGWPMFSLWWAFGHEPAALPHLLASAPTWNHLQGLWLHSYGDIPAPDFPVTALVPWVGGQIIPIADGVQLWTANMPHSDTFPVLGLRIEAGDKVVGLTADTRRSDRIPWVGANADLLIHDARHAATAPPRLDVQERFHTTARDAGEYAALAGAKKLALVHIGAEYAGREAELVAEARTAFAGEVFAPAGGDVVTL